MSTAVNYDFPDAEKEKAKCRDFLQNFKIGEQRKYFNQLHNIADRQLKCLEIDMDDVERHKADLDFAHHVATNTLRYIKHFEEVADELMPVAANTDKDVYDVLNEQRMAAHAAAGDPAAAPPDIPKSLTRRFEVVILPSSTLKPRKLREIRANDVGHLIKVRGMVSRVTDVKPLVTVATYTCEVCSSEIFQEVNGTQYMPLQACPSQTCKDNRSTGQLVMRTRGSRFIKYQELRIQELPDQVPVGHIPRTVTVHCRYNTQVIVDAYLRVCSGERTRQCGPGDIVTIDGIFLTVRYSGFRGITAGLQSDTYIEAMSIEKVKQNYEHIQIDQAAQEQLDEIVSSTDAYSRLACSIAPEIYGHEDVKKALLLQLVGGTTRVLPDGMKIRGDINICLMGDPGVAKSQLLKYIATIAPRGVYTTGKGSSGVGLTAAIIRDNLTGELALEGGALVLADKGICCIDEFDKMDDSDRTAIHEVMEQQTISVAKAGITTTLNARAAVLAAANPLYGRYNKRKSVSENVDLPNSLLSRFDLLFLILDRVDMQSDLALSKHVLHVHKYLRNPELAFTPVEPTAIKQYIAHARNIDPCVPVELTSYIVESYVTMRMQDASGNQYGRRQKQSSGDQAVMTPRLLLSILRMSQALARLRLSNVITHEDVDEAIRLTHASKASLQDDVAAIPQEDIISAIFSMLRSFAVQRKTTDINYAQAEAMIIKKGFTATQLQTCLQEYQSLGVIHVDQDKTNISFEG